MMPIARQWEGLQSFAELDSGSDLGQCIQCSCKVLHALVDLHHVTSWITELLLTTGGAGFHGPDSQHASCGGA